MWTDKGTTGIFRWKYVSLIRSQDCTLTLKNRLKQFWHHMSHPGKILSPKLLKLSLVKNFILSWEIKKSQIYILNFSLNVNHLANFRYVMVSSDFLESFWCIIFDPKILRKTSFNSGGFPSDLRNLVGQNCTVF